LIFLFVACVSATNLRLEDETEVCNKITMIPFDYSLDIFKLGLFSNPYVVSTHTLLSSRLTSQKTLSTLFFHRIPQGRQLGSYRRTSNCDYVIDAFEDWFDCCVEDDDRRRLEDSTTDDTDKSKSSSTPKSSTTDASRDGRRKRDDDDGKRKKRSRRYKKSTTTGRRRSVKCNDPDYDDDDVYFAIKDCDFDDLVDALE